MVALKVPESVLDFVWYVVGNSINGVSPYSNLIFAVEPLLIKVPLSVATLDVTPEATVVVIVGTVPAKETDGDMTKIKLKIKYETLFNNVLFMAQL